MRIYTETYIIISEVIIMNIKQYIEEKGISIYKLANEANVAYPTVFNMVNGKVNLMNCYLGIVK